MLLLNQFSAACSEADADNGGILALFGLFLVSCATIAIFSSGIHVMAIPYTKWSMNRFLLQYPSDNGLSKMKTGARCSREIYSPVYKKSLTEPDLLALIRHSTFNEIFCSVSSDCSRNYAFSM